MEVAKTRLQLDGELGGRIPATTVPSTGATPLIPNAAGLSKPVAGAGGVRAKVYTSAADCMRKTWKFEGIGGVQRGLGAAVGIPFTLSTMCKDCAISWG